ncbi:Tfp pilus assembly protein PilF [Jejuia pallidilutea]|uniref:Tfp pilus assembly protein PilF n=1 Tax=Jejuia pallidilutea TaxID=504487 RepID=A0A362WY91_9FLAO|nr:tetratricopeptide repeat protein [Jejuia pallidilutea]PQV46560.1 Tfp pilus assembly protein PilF [Jejuia pallidilutea]
MKPIHLLVCSILLFVGCKKTSNIPDLVTNSEDYNRYLNIEKNEVVDAAKQDYKFWEEKLEKEPNQFPYLVKAAASQSQLFAQTGSIAHLKYSEKGLVAANKATHYKNSGYLRALARNYVSQHKFKSALELLKKAEINGDKLKSTQKMLFDVHLELGDDEAAKQYLSRIENYKDFDFLIRLSKWNDYKGNLEDAILYLKKATEIVETSKNKGLMQWSYTNLADYYGHAGKIQTAYKYYLKALELDPNDAYAKKGIAWIVYSHEKNPDEALRILNAITETYNAPDYYLLKAEIADFKGDIKQKEVQLKLYKTAVANAMYGDMYNQYNILLFAESEKQTAKALEIAHKETENRPTAQSYNLLAWTHYKQGAVKKALEIMENYVVGKTFEPEALYHLAKVYKANGKTEAAKKLKKQLLESSFELGPLMTESIKSI